MQLNFIISIVFLGTIHQHEIGNVHQHENYMTVNLEIIDFVYFTFLKNKMADSSDSYKKKSERDTIIIIAVVKEIDMS